MGSIAAPRAAPRVGALPVPQTGSPAPTIHGTDLASRFVYGRGDPCGRPGVAWCLHLPLRLWATWELDTQENRIYSSYVSIYASLRSGREYVAACSRVQKEGL